MMGREGRFTTSPASFTRSYFLPVKITESQTVVGRSQMSRRFVNQQTHNITGYGNLKYNLVRVINLTVGNLSYLIATLCVGDFT